MVANETNNLRMSILVPFQLGNQLAARPNKRLYFSGAIRRHIKENPTALHDVIKALFAEAAAGDVQAARELADRIDGKAVARTELSGANGAALFPVVAITVIGVSADDDDMPAIEPTAMALEAPTLIAHDLGVATLADDDENVA